MRPPIIVNEHGDVQIFEVVGHAEIALEAIDVRNDEYAAYDSDGRRLAITVCDRDDQVRISGDENSVTGRDELKTVLSVFLMRTGDSEAVKEMSLQELIERFVAKHGFAR